LSVRENPVRVEFIDQLPFSTQAELRSFGLTNRMSAETFVQMAQSAGMRSNRERYVASGLTPQDFRGSKIGATNWEDRRLGLDQYVFFDWPRPAVQRREQAEITIVVEPEVMSQPGVIMTEQDFYDAKSVRDYMQGLLTPEYFYAAAVLRILNSVADSYFVTKDIAEKSRRIAS
jgi:hypothetical protein